VVNGWEEFVGNDDVCIALLCCVVLCCVVRERERERKGEKRKKGVM
jgi:hypothetical protein